jgi:hypothetical protein
LDEIKKFCPSHESGWNAYKIAGVGLTKREGYTAGKKSERYTICFDLKILRSNKTFEDLRVDGVIMLKWTSEIGGVRAKTGLD